MNQPNVGIFRNGGSSINYERIMSLAEDDSSVLDEYRLRPPSAEVRDAGQRGDLGAYTKAKGYDQSQMSPLKRKFLELQMKGTPNLKGSTAPSMDKVKPKSKPRKSKTARGRGFGYLSLSKAIKQLAGGPKSTKARLERAVGPKLYGWLTDEIAKSKPVRFGKRGKALKKRGPITAKSAEQIGGKFFGKMSKAYPFSDKSGKSPKDRDERVMNKARFVRGLALAYQLLASNVSKADKASARIWLTSKKKKLRMFEWELLRDLEHLGEAVYSAFMGIVETSEQELEECIENFDSLEEDTFIDDIDALCEMFDEVLEEGSRKYEKAFGKEGEWVKLDGGREYSFRWEGMNFATIIDERKSYGGNPSLRYSVDGDKFKSLRAAKSRGMSLATEAILREGYKPKSLGESRTSARQKKIDEIVRLLKKAGRLTGDEMEFRKGMEQTDDYDIRKLLKNLKESVDREELTIDEGKQSHEARELELYIDNNNTAPYKQKRAIFKNLAKKKAKGRYDRKLAIKGMMHAVDAGARAYTKEHGSPGDKPSMLFPRSARHEVASMFVDDFEDEFGNGGIDEDVLDEGFRLRNADRLVLKAFLMGQAQSSKKLSTDGDTLNGNWMGGLRIASLDKNGGVTLHPTGSRAGDTIHRALSKMAGTGMTEMKDLSPGYLLGEGLLAENLDAVDEALTYSANHRVLTEGMDYHKLGAQLQHWHNGEGTPAYKVGSMLFAGRKPWRKDVCDTIEDLQAMMMSPRYGEHESELRSIISRLRSVCMG